MKRLPNVFFGGVEICGKTLREFLGEHSYALRFHVDDQLAVLKGEGGEEILRIQCAYESAVKLAGDLGLTTKSTFMPPLEWHVHVDKFELHHDGSPEADQLLLKIIEYEIPHTIRRNCPVVGFAVNGSGMHKNAMWSFNDLMEMVEKRGNKKVADKVA